MITVNFGDLLAKLSSQETKQVLVQSNIAVIENSEPTLQENKGKKTYYDNVQKIRDFVSSESHEKAEIKKFQTQCKQVITSPFFNFNDIGKKGVKSVIQNRFWNLLAVLVEKHLNSIDDESLSTILYELFSFDEEWITQTENAFHQTLETLIQENDSFRKFHTICSDLLDLNEQDSESAKKYFLIYIMCLLCQKPIEKLWFMRAVTKLETKTIQHLLEILYFIAVPFSSEYENTGIKVSLKIVYEYISWTVNCSFEKIRNDTGIQRLLQLFSKNLKGKLNEVETLAGLDNLNSLIKSQSLKLDTIDLRKNLNLEDFAF